MHFLTKLLKDQIDEEVHKAFTGYSQGTFPGPIIELNVSKKNIKAKSGPYYSRFLLEFITLHLPAEAQVTINGVIESNSDLKDTINEYDLSGSLKRKKGVHIWKGEANISGKQLKSLTDALLSNCTIFLDIDLVDSELPWKLKTKKKISKGQLQKPPDTKFATAVFNNTPEIMDSLKDMLYPDFSLPSYKKLLLKNEYVVEGLEIPDDPSLDPRTKRLQTKRMGVLHRTSSLMISKEETKELTSKKQFSA